jgi:hypothetical protein
VKRIVQSLVGALLICGFSSAWADPEIPAYYQLNGYKEFDSLDKAAAYKKGVAMARHDFGRGVYRFLVFGRRAGGETVDEEKLRKNYSIYFVPIAGCIVDDGIEGAADGYNKTMRALLEKAYDKDMFAGVFDDPKG